MAGWVLSTSDCTWDVVLLDDIRVGPQVGVHANAVVRSEATPLDLAMAMAHRIVLPVSLGLRLSLFDLLTFKHVF